MTFEIKTSNGHVLYTSFAASTMAACLTEAAKGGANLRDANLYGADLTATDVSDAQLDGADLRRAKNLTKALLASAKGKPIRNSKPAFNRSNWPIACRVKRRTRSTRPASRSTSSKRMAPADRSADRC